MSTPWIRYLSSLAGMLAVGLAVTVWPWAAARLGCLGSAVYMGPLWVLVALAAAEAGFLRRFAFVSLYLEPTGWLRPLLWPGSLLWLWQGVKALFLTFVLVTGGMIRSITTGKEACWASWCDDGSGHSMPCCCGWLC